MKLQPSTLGLVVLLTGCLSDREVFGASRAGESPRTLIFNNGTEPEYLDPGQATGQPDGRIITELFDGLTEYDPKDLGPVPSLAASWDEHPDGKGYTFHLRPDAVWTDGRPVTAEDFAWSWARVLHPVFRARYAGQLYTVRHAKRFNQGRLFRLTRESAGLPAQSHVVGIRSLAATIDTTTQPLESPGRGATVGSLDAGVLVSLTGETSDVGDVTWHEVTWRPSCPDMGALASQLNCTDTFATGWTPHVTPAWPLVGERVIVESTELQDAEVPDRLEPGDTVMVLHEDGERAEIFFSQRDRFGWVPLTALANPRGETLMVEVEVLPQMDWGGQAPEPDSTTVAKETREEAPAPSEEAETGTWTEPVVEPPSRAVVPLDALAMDPGVMGFRAVDDHTLEVRLEGVAPYFLQQTSHYALRAAPKWAIARHGMAWTRPENIVSNGPFQLVEHRVRDRFVLDANPTWWGADDLALDRVIAFSMDNAHASLNLYYTGHSDFLVSGDIPTEFIPIVKAKKDFRVSPAMTVYFYRLNVTKPPLDDPRVRRALAMTIERTSIVEDILQAGQLPANHLVPPGMAGYEGPEGPDFDPEAARALLAEAGFPGGEGFPKMSVLYNTSESHKQIASVIQQNWKEHLGIDIELQNKEWKTYLKDMHSLNYDMARSGWIGDYVDPNTFLDMWVTGGGNNETGWSSPEYDRLIEEAGREADPAVRLEKLQTAEALLNEEMPIIPIYWYVWTEMQQPDVRGHYPNLLDQHPLRFLSLDR